MADFGQNRLWPKPTLAKPTLAKVGLAKVGRITMAKVGLAKVGFDLLKANFTATYCITGEGWPPLSPDLAYARLSRTMTHSRPLPDRYVFATSWWRRHGITPLPPRPHRQHRVLWKLPTRVIASSRSSKNHQENERDTLHTHPTLQAACKLSCAFVRQIRPHSHWA